MVKDSELLELLSAERPGLHRELHHAAGPRFRTEPKSTPVEVDEAVSDEAGHRETVLSED